MLKQESYSFSMPTEVGSSFVAGLGLISSVSDQCCLGCCRVTRDISCWVLDNAVTLYTSAKEEDFLFSIKKNKEQR